MKKIEMNYMLNQCQYKMKLIQNGPTETDTERSWFT